MYLSLPSSFLSYNGLSLSLPISCIASPLSAAPPLPPPQEEQITSSRSDTKLPPAGGLPRSKSSGSLAVKPSDVPPDIVIGGGGGGACQGRGRTHTTLEEQTETGATGKGENSLLWETYSMLIS